MFRSLIRSKSVSSGLSGVPSGSPTGPDRLRVSDCCRLHEIGCMLMVFDPLPGVALQTGRSQRWLPEQSYPIVKERKELEWHFQVGNEYSK